MRSIGILAAVMLFSACATPAATNVAQSPAPSPLVGNWHQSQDECGAATINELLFKADGTFHVTWTPFETYEDYWGAFRYDATSGQLDLTIANGNNIPSDVVPSGHVTLAGGALTFDGASLGSTHDAPLCGAAFHRRGPAP